MIDPYDISQAVDPIGNNKFTEQWADKLLAEKAWGDKKKYLDELIKVIEPH